MSQCRERSERRKNQQFGINVHILYLFNIYINVSTRLQWVNSRVVHTDEMLFLAECIPISELGCEKIALYSFIYIAHKTLMMY